MFVDHYLPLHSDCRCDLYVLVLMDFLQKEIWCCVRSWLCMTHSQLYLSPSWMNVPTWAMVSWSRMCLKCFSRVVDPNNQDLPLSCLSLPRSMVLWLCIDRFDRLSDGLFIVVPRRCIRWESIFTARLSNMRPSLSTVSNHPVVASTMSVIVVFLHSRRRLCFFFPASKIGRLFVSLQRISTKINWYAVVVSSMGFATVWRIPSIPAISILLIIPLMPLFAFSGARLGTLLLQDSCSQREVLAQYCLCTSPPALRSKFSIGLYVLPVAHSLDRDEAFRAQGRRFLRLERGGSASIMIPLLSSHLQLSLMWFLVFFCEGSVGVFLLCLVEIAVAPAACLKASRRATSFFPRHWWGMWGGQPLHQSPMPDRQWQAIRQYLLR